MINFDDIIDFLAQKGVKSLHIEMQSRELSETQERDIERLVRGAKPDETSAKKADEKDISVQPALTFSILDHVEVVDGHDAVEMTFHERTVASAAEDLSKTITVSQPSVVEKPVMAQESGNEELGKTAAGSPSGVSNTAPKNVYETFCDLVSKDDGSVTKERRMELISKMGLDDLLRINNDFQLGLDTDKPTEDIRADVAECF